MRYIYITTNSINGKRYLGQRKTPKGKTPETDSYLGSGTLLLKAIKKYGREVFYKEIIHKCYTQKDADTLEIQEISERRVLENKNKWYNRDAGGQYGRSEKHSQIASEYMKEFYSKEENINRNIKGVNKARVKKGLKPLPYTNLKERNNYKENVLPKLKAMKKLNFRYRQGVVRAINHYKSKKTLKYTRTPEERKAHLKRIADIHREKMTDERKQALVKSRKIRSKLHREGKLEYFKESTRKAFMLAKYRQHSNYLAMYIVENTNIDLKPVEATIKRVNGRAYKNDNNYLTAINEIVEYVNSKELNKISGQQAHEFINKRREELKIRLNTYKKVL